MANGTVSGAQASHVRSLLAKRLSQRRIALRAGVSRDTVARIARGDRPYLETPSQKREEVETLAPDCNLTGCGKCVMCKALDAQRRSLAARQRAESVCLRGEKARRRSDELFARALT